MIFKGSSALMFGGMALIDIPLAVVTDTLCLPYDGYQYLRYEGDIAYWNDFFAATNNLSQRACRWHLTKYTQPLVEKRLAGVKLSENQLYTLMDIRKFHSALAKRADLTQATADRLLTESGDVYAVKYYLALNSRAPSNIVLRLSTDSNRGIVWIAARNPQLPLSRMSELASSSQLELLREIASNPAVSAEIQRALLLFASKSPDPYTKYAIRKALAANCRTEVSILIELSNDVSLFEALIRNQATPTDALRNIIGQQMRSGSDKGSHWLSEALHHRNCSAELIREVYKQPDLSPWYALTASNTPPDVISAMTLTCQKEGKLRDFADIILTLPNTGIDTLIFIRDYLNRNVRPAYKHYDDELLAKYDKRIDDMKTANNPAHATGKPAPDR